ncbi:hypothetical protein SASPL_150348 [Salvia splendens]|uniref:RRM domain-containing protein n=1 Tax=Salvia splendens TaxID=180675 RepID=A0A8X8W5Y2_SALSN|nr:hypothetical protein SASPL_150348 [Salvia splendens]
MARRVSSELFVSRLSFYITTGELEKLFSPFGLIEQVRLVKDPRTQRPKGFGFVKYAREIDAKNALKAMNGRVVNSRIGDKYPDIDTSESTWENSWHFLSQLCCYYPGLPYAIQGIIIFSPVSAYSKVPTTFTVDSAGEGIDILPDSGGSDDSIGGGGGNGGGGGGGGNDGDNGDGQNEDQSHEKKGGMSMFQKLTLGYAALVGFGGAMGYLKGGSQKSLIAGGVSASVLLFVYAMLPSNPFLASSVGLLLSASLLGVMGLRFKKSGKIFPTGVVSFVSLVMTGGYFHGILRGLH